MTNITQIIIKYLLENPPQTGADIDSAKRTICKQTKISKPPTNSEILSELKKKNIKNDHLKNILRKRAIRTMSGVAPIAVLTKYYPCPGTCAYCPKEKDMPTSYLSNEPAVMRAINCDFNPYRQVQLRLHALENNGHLTDKLELIVMGGTWSYFPTKYKYWYIRECFRSANDFPHDREKKESKNPTLLEIKKSLAREQKRNEKARARIIGLTLETRPDYINQKELSEMRELGCTRIEIGVQHIDDKILQLNKRGHDIATTVEATRLMREFGFKITYHFMLNLPGSTPAKDLAMMKATYSDPRFQPDQIKLYPTVVARGSLLYKWWRAGKWKAYSTKQLVDTLIKIKSITPPWVRIIRVIRDIPEESIIAGNKITNLRQNIQAKMKEQGLTCDCIRCREAGHSITKDKKINSRESILINRQYKVNDGTEIFLSFESKDLKHLFAFCRLFLPENSDTAIIRELHTYGSVTPIGATGRVQHLGLGKKLIAEAEKITSRKKYSRLKIISGIGVRDYYRRLGYRLNNTYMIKRMSK